MVSFAQLGRDSDFSQPCLGGTSIAVFLAVAVFMDFWFGVIHIFEHKVPKFWAKHKIHHQYKREDLNYFANTYSHFHDSVGMEASVVICLLATYLIGGPRVHNFLIYFDLMVAAGMTHHKYGVLQMNLCFFWELDAVDIVAGELSNRISTYHYAHHNVLTSRFSLYGITSDEVLERVTAPFLAADQQPHKVTTASPGVSLTASGGARPCKWGCGKNYSNANSLSSHQSRCSLKVPK
eukprot:TRINITY_DN10438_c0_g2_i4.p1 TRINITY_DN10438_c0_g2~~TRINITY_DN10438_c0_g2_i4.p1  ORF type:complete len:236 (-),score=38.57 TRINITY_DN10438_c0_g2_i4:406-1113(-)